MAYTKLSSTIVNSTVWAESDRTLRIWIGLLALADARGQVVMSRFSLRKILEVSFDDLDAALEIFKSPDPHSRSTELEGRRIIEIDGGWQLVNYAAYRCLDSEEHRRSKNAEYQRIHRENKALANADKSKISKKPSSKKSYNKISSAVSVHSDSDSDSDSEANADPDLLTRSDPDPECAIGQKSKKNDSRSDQQPADKNPSISQNITTDFWQDQESEREEISRAEFCENDTISASLLPVEAGLSPDRDGMLVHANFDSLPERFKSDHNFAAWPERGNVLAASIAAYNQARPANWLAANPESNQLKRRLEAIVKILRQHCPDPDHELVRLIGHATLAMRTSELHCKKSFSSNHLGWLISDLEKLQLWAEKGQSLVDQGDQVAEDALKPQRQYRDLAGKPCTRGDVMRLAVKVNKNTAGEVERKWLLDNWGDDPAEAGEVEYLLQKWNLTK